MGLTSLLGSILNRNRCSNPGTRAKLGGRSTTDFVRSLWACEGKAVPTMTINNVMGITDNVKKLPGTSFEKMFGLPLDVQMESEHPRADFSMDLAVYRRADAAESWKKTVFRHPVYWREKISEMLVHGIDMWAPKIPVKKVVVEFSSSRVGTGMHMAHLRSAAVGESLCRMLEFSNVKVLRQNHLDDWSSELGQLIEFLLEKFQNWEDETQITFADLEKSLMDASKRCMEDPVFRERAQEAVIRLKHGESKYQKVWAQICDISRREFDSVRLRLGVKLEEKSGSFYQAYIPDVLEKLRDNGLVQECRDGRALMYGGVDTSCDREVILESDGDSFSRASIDLAALWYRIYEEKAEWIIYVADVADYPHFHMLFETARHAGWLASKIEDYPEVSFVGFDEVYRKEGKIFKSLFGESERLVNLLDEAKAKSKATLVQLGKDKEWKEEELEQMAEAIGCGAIKYTDLKHGSDFYVLNLDRVLNGKGNNVVKLLNAHARLCSIIMNSGKDIEALKRKEKITFHHGSERALGVRLLEFTEAMECACAGLSPNTLRSYLHKLNRFLVMFQENCPVVVGSPEETSRLLLCQATEVVMRQCFHLLGIEVGSPDLYKSPLLILFFLETVLLTRPQLRFET